MERPHGTFLLMMDLRKQIFIFRDLIHLPTCDGSSSIVETVLATLKDLHRMFPEFIPTNLLEMNRDPLDHVLFKFSEVLESVGESWTAHPDWLDYEAIATSETAVHVALLTLNCVIKLARDHADVDEDGSALEKRSFCGSPVTPTSVLSDFLDSPRSPESPKIYCSSPTLRSMRLQAVEKLHAFDIKRLPFHVSARECPMNTRDELIFEMDDNGKISTSPLPPVKIQVSLQPPTELPDTPLLSVTTPPFRNDVTQAATALAEDIPATRSIQKHVLPAAPTPPDKTPAALPFSKHMIPASSQKPVKHQGTSPFKAQNIPAAPPPPLGIQERIPTSSSFQNETITASAVTIPAPPPLPVKDASLPQHHKVDTTEPKPMNHKPKQVIPEAPALPIKRNTILPFISAPPPPSLPPKQIIPGPPGSIPAAPAPPMKGAGPPPPPPSF